MCCPIHHRTGASIESTRKTISGRYFLEEGRKEGKNRLDDEGWKYEKIKLHVKIHIVFVECVYQYMSFLVHATRNLFRKIVYVRLTAAHESLPRHSFSS